MSAAFSLVLVLLTVFAVAGFLKLAARLFRRTTVSWLHALLFGMLLLGISVAKVISGYAFSVVVPHTVAMVLGTALTVGVGTWFFSTRARTAQGVPVGWRGSLQLTGIAVGLMAGFGLSLMLLLNVLRPMQP